MIDVADSNTVYYYHFDGLGSVIALSDQNADLVESYSYDVFGKPSNTSDVNNPYLFTGRRYDDETGLYYYRARYYDYATGRFMQSDPLLYNDGLNLYSYVGNNPGNWVDPMGLIKWSPLPGTGIYYGDDQGDSTQGDKCKGDKGDGDGFINFWDDVIQWCDAIELCLNYVTNPGELSGLNDKYKHMYISYELSEIAGPKKARLIGVGNEVVDLVFGEGFNIGDIMSDELGIETQQSDMPKDEAIEVFDAAAPIIHGGFDIKVKVIPIPKLGTYVIVY